MAYDTAANATWTYDNGTLTHVASGQSVTIDIAGNPALHKILGADHWLNLGSKTVYSDDPEDWHERDIKWNRATEDPPVLQIEQNIGEGDYQNYTVYLLEDSPGYSDLFQHISDLMDEGVANGFTKAIVKQIEKDRVTIWQRAGLISGGDSEG